METQLETRSTPIINISLIAGLMEEDPARYRRKVERLQWLSEEQVQDPDDEYIKGLERRLRKLDR